MISMRLAHGNRRVAKPSSGTISSDDLDEREMGTVYEGGESSLSFATILTLLNDCLAPHTEHLHLTSMICLMAKHQLVQFHPTESQDPLSESNGMTGKVRTSRAALTHRLKKTKTKMIKCKQCENYVLVNGVECVEVCVPNHTHCAVPLIK